MRQVKTLEYQTNRRIVKWEIEQAVDVIEITQPGDEWRYYKAGDIYTLTVRIYEDES